MEYICVWCHKNFGNHKTEYRKHIKECKEKPEVLKCKFCSKECKSFGFLKIHEEYQCKLNPNKKEQKHTNNLPKASKRKTKEGGWTCLCGLFFRTRKELFAHKKDCKINLEKRGNRMAHINYVDFICQFCKQPFIHKPINTKTQHENYCIDNPNRKRIKGKKLTQEQKNHLSDVMKEKITNGDFISPYKRNHSSKMSYPEKYFSEVLKDLHMEYNFPVGRYELDFSIPDKKIYIEIDGEQHYVDNKISVHDVERTENLKNEGWKLLARVRWSKYQKLPTKYKNIFCEKLIALIKANI